MQYVGLGPIMVRTRPLIWRKNVSENAGVSTELQAGSYTAISRPNGVMKKPYNRC